MANSPYLVAVTAQNFQEVVLEGSYDRPVLGGGPTYRCAVRYPRAGAS